MTKMQRHVVFEIEQLVDIVKGRINIYGAKSRALCLKKYLQNHGIEIESFLVSKDYDNPECLDGINVKKIEDRPLYKYGCLIIAVGLQYIYDIEKYIDKYDIEVLVIIDPSITTFPGVQVVSDESVISEKTYISPEAFIYVDDTSAIVVNGKMIKKGASIVAKNGSFISIGEGVTIDNDFECIVENESKFIVKNVDFGRDISFYVANNSLISMYDKCRFGKDNVIKSIDKSEIIFDGNNDIDNSGLIQVCRSGRLHVGNHTSINTHVYISIESILVDIGIDVMISHYVKMAGGGHNIFDMETRKEITNYNPIMIGNHVWIGMGCIVLPGTNILNGSIVGAGTITNKMIETDTVYVGNKARCVRQNVKWNRDSSDYDGI